MIADHHAILLPSREKVAVKQMDEGPRR